MRRDTLTFLLFALGILPFAGIIFLGYNVPMESDCKADADCGQESACVNGYCALLSRCEVYNPYRTSPYYRYGSSYPAPAYNQPYRPAYPAPAYNQPYRSPSYNPYVSASASGGYNPELIQARLRLTLAQSRLRSTLSILQSYSRNYQTYRRLWNQNPLPTYKNLMESSAARVREYRLRADQERLAIATARAQLALAEQRGNSTAVATPSATPSSPATPATPGTSGITGGLGGAGDPAPAASVSAGPSQPATAAKTPAAPLPLVKECPLDSYCEPTLNRCVRSAPRTTFFAHFHPGYWSYRAQYQTIIRSGGSYSRYQLASFRSGGLGFGK